ncbi:MAG: hypothetical protein LBB58_06440 [Cellulomonadaceae bacterium]|jgi:hypothetical protein|nr:hypothetical protein [Cellulomonadaceae bacterium]
MVTEDNTAAQDTTTAPPDDESRSYQAKTAHDGQLDSERAAERALQEASEFAPPLEHRFPGEIGGTLSAEDVNSHEHERAGQPD